MQLDVELEQVLVSGARLGTELLMTPLAGALEPQLEAIGQGPLDRSPFLLSA